jgi:hypothetical protein
MDEVLAAAAVAVSARSAAPTATRVPDHGGMTIRPPPGFPLPELVLVANQVLAEEAEALRAALDDFGKAPQPGCPWEQGDSKIANRSRMVTVSNRLAREAGRFQDR